MCLINRAKEIGMKNQSYLQYTVLVDLIYIIINTI